MTIRAVPSPLPPELEAERQMHRQRFEAAWFSKFGSSARRNPSSSQARWIIPRETEEAPPPPPPEGIPQLSIPERVHHDWARPDHRILDQQLVQSVRRAMMQGRVEAIDRQQRGIARIWRATLTSPDIINRVSISTQRRIAELIILEITPERLREACKTKEANKSDHELVTVLKEEA